MRLLRHCTLLALTVALASVPRVAAAQAGAPSDSVSENVLDSTGAAVPLVAPPPVVVMIPETAPSELALTVPMPGREINFLESTGAAQLISDRLSISPYELVVQSDDEGGLPARTNAILIPASALETFQPIRIIARSDGEVVGSNQSSDSLTITLGYYGPGTGTVIFSGTISEPTEGVTEASLTAVIPPTLFDIDEPPLETGGVLGKISDYLDIPAAIQVSFISSDEQGIYANLPPANGAITENVEAGGSVVYAVDFISDAVPEPASWMLLSIGLLSAGLIQFQRRFA